MLIIYYTDRCPSGQLNCEERERGRHAPERNVGPSYLTNEATPAILLVKTIRIYNDY